MAFYIKQNDTSPSILAELKDANNTPVNLTAATAKIFIKSVDGTLKVNEDLQIINAALGVVRYDWQVGDTNTVGTYSVEFQVTYTDGAVETFPNTGSIALVVTKELN
jgi:hypothetical protein